jgi:serine/threonine protein phosphatase PrpC
VGQHHGISPCPSLSVCEVQAMDVIIVASDGLWNSLGGRRAPDNTGHVPQQLSPQQPLFVRMRGM